MTVVPIGSMALCILWMVIISETGLESCSPQERIKAIKIMAKTDSNLRALVSQI